MRPIHADTPDPRREASPDGALMRLATNGERLGEATCGDHVELTGPAHPSADVVNFGKSFTAITSLLMSSGNGISWLEITACTNTTWARRHG
jgi:hypothetical protein